MSIFCTKFALTCAFVSLWTGVASAQAVFVRLGDLPGGVFESSAIGVSDDGSTVVGVSEGSNGREAFRWQAGIMTGLGDLPGGDFASIALAASADGSVIVGRGTTASRFESVQWQDGVLTSLGGFPGGTGDGSAIGVSPDGTIIVGYARNASDFREAYRFSGGVMQGLGDLPGGNFHSVARATSSDGSVVSGDSATDATPLEAFRWDAGSMVGLGFLAEDPGTFTPFSSWATDVTPDGSTIVGQSSNLRLVFDPYSGQYVEGKYEEPFRVEAGTMTSLFDGTSPGDPPGQPWTYGTAMAVSADGSVVVGYGFGAFIWIEDHGIRDLEEFLETEHGLDLTGWAYTEAHDLSADGRVIVGFGRNPAGDTEAWMVVLPVIPAVPTLSLGGQLMVAFFILASTGRWCMARKRGLAAPIAHVTAM